MKWKDTEQTEQPENEESRDEYFEENYSPLKRPKFDFGLNVAAILGKPVFWYIVGGCVFVLLIIVLLSSGKGDSRQFSVFEERLARLEKRILVVEDITTRLSALEKDAGNSGMLETRMERLETTIAKKMNEMETKINRLSLQRAATTQPGGTAYHVVQKGDTLYGISKRYGITIDGLRKLNKLGKAATIQPGQKLRVK